MYAINFLVALVTLTGVITALYVEGPGKRNQEASELSTNVEEWTIIQRREPRTGLQVDFYLTWNEYVSGFGLVNGSHWLGLEAIHELTKNQDQELQVVLTDFDDIQRVANYGRFWISNAVDSYRLFVANYSGDAGDGLSSHSGMKFSTKDNDNDGSPISCAELVEGAWWYNNCYDSTLNGIYHDGPFKINGVQWMPFRGYDNLKHVEIKIRRNMKI